MNMQDFWNQRYSDNKYAYGIEPNHFFKIFIDNHEPGKILLPADGESRNGIYAAQKGWDVDAFDFSESAREKALNLAKDLNAEINYFISDFSSVKLTSNYYDAIGLIYAHLPSKIRTDVHHKFIDSLKPGGFIVLEAFSKEQLSFNSGGPKKADLLYDINGIKEDFHQLVINSIDQKIIELSEGPYHKGKGNVIQMTAQKSE